MNTMSYRWIRFRRWLERSRLVGWGGAIFPARTVVGVALVLGSTMAMSGRERLPIDDNWAFHRGDAAGAQAPDFNADSWTHVDLPHDWSIALPVDANAPSLGGGGFYPTGIGWYRHSFPAPEAWRRQQISLEFDGVYMNADVWVNGKHFGTHPYGYTPFRYDITAAVNIGRANTIAVRVDNSQEPNSRWYAGSGIYRHVRLVITAPIHVEDESTLVRTETLSSEAAAIDCAFAIRNDTERAEPVGIEIVVLGPDGKEVAQASQELTVAAQASINVPHQFAVPHPHPWSPATPVRYRVVTRLTQNHRAIDEAVTPFGIRTIGVSATGGFELNGRALKLVGANVHADNGPLGAAAFDRAEQRRAELLKRAGFNAVRTSHNPPAPAFVEACDRLGLLVLEEAFDGWAKGKNPHDYSVAMHEWWQRDLDAMVRRDRNHPSVVLWSIGNEMYERGNAAGLQIATELTRRIRELDPSRPITAGVNGPGRNGDWTKFDPLFATLDVAGYNYEIGRHAADHARVPNRVIVITESYQRETFANWAIVHDTPYVIGEFVWSGIDYLGETGIGRVFAPGEPVVRHWEGNQWPWHGAACGDIDLIGDRKPISHYRQIVWDRGEKLYATVVAPSPSGQPWGVSPWTVVPTRSSWTWPGEEGRALNVEVYSRHEQVRLFLNDQLIGEKPTGRAEEFRATFAVPYAPGVLKAVGVDDGREADSFVLATAGPAARIRLTADRPVLQADGQDLVFVTVELTDAQGRLVPNADRTIRFTVNGPATLAALGNADLASFETYQSNPHRTFDGHALVVLRSTHEHGIVTLAAAADGLTAANVTLQSFAR